MEGSSQGEAPAAALAAVLKHSSGLPPESAQVRGYDFNRGVDYRALLQAYGTIGFQATNFGRAVQQVNAMVRARLPWQGWGLPWAGISVHPCLSKGADAGKFKVFRSGQSLEQDRVVRGGNWRRSVSQRGAWIWICFSQRGRGLDLKRRCCGTAEGTGSVQETFLGGV